MTKAFYLPIRVGRKYFIAKDEMSEYVAKAAEKWGIEGYSIQDIMGRIPLSYAFVMDLIKSGKLPAVKVGRQYIVPKGEFEKFMEDKKNVRNSPFAGGFFFVNVEYYKRNW